MLLALWATTWWIKPLDNNSLRALRAKDPRTQPFTDDAGCDELVCWNFLQQLVVHGLVEEDQVVQLVAGLSIGPQLTEKYFWDQHIRSGILNLGYAYPKVCANSHRGYAKGPNFRISIDSGVRESLKVESYCLRQKEFNPDNRIIRQDLEYTISVV